MHVIFAFLITEERNSCKDFFVFFFACKKCSIEGSKVSKGLKEVPWIFLHCCKWTRLKKKNVFKRYNKAVWNLQEWVLLEFWLPDKSQRTIFYLFKNLLFFLFYKCFFQNSVLFFLLEFILWFFFFFLTSWVEHLTY